MTLDCRDCNGRGYLSVDMMGTAFTACPTCQTHETRQGMFGSYVVRKPKQADIDMATSWMNDLSAQQPFIYGAIVRDELAIKIAELRAALQPTPTEEADDVQV